MHQITNYIPLVIRRSILHKSMLWLGIPVIGISGIMIAIGYHYEISTLEYQASEKLKNYVSERSKRESQIFLLAQKNHSRLAPILLKELKKSRSTNPNIAFNNLVKPWPDGTHRNFDSSKPIQNFDTSEAATIFIGQNVPLTPSLKQDVLVFNKLVNLYGRGWQTSFTDTWIIGAQNVMVLYWPGMPWGLNAPKDLNILKEEYSYVANKTNDPDRIPKWTGVYFDSAAQQWMASLVTPVDDERGNHLASIGHDIMLNDLIDRTQNLTLPGASNLIMSEEGRLIVDRDWIDAIRKANGQITIQQLNDPELTHIWKHAKKLTKETEITTSPDQSNLIAISQLAGTDWFFTTRFPKVIIYDQALKNILPLIILSLCAVILEILFIYLVLFKQVNQPLQKLLTATEQISSGEFDLQLNLDRIDEVGNLSRSFTHMAQDLQTSFAQLNLQNETLESQVVDRTQELTMALHDLKSTQGQLVQSEKMSGLGQMIAGIAHEINNPVSFIHGNLHPANQYIKDLLHHLHLYQRKAKQTEINDHAEEIDLEFLEIDLPKLLNSMNIGTDRIREIILSLRNFSRLDEAELKTVNLHEGIDSTLLILNHRFKQSNPEIIIKKDYRATSTVNCYPSQLNQVVMNLLSNSIDALESYTSQCFAQSHHNQLLEEEGITPWKPEISIATLSHSESIEITIHDNGSGISEEVKEHIFDPFFTTKVIGKGTGLGLSISHSIIVERHKGAIVCESNSIDGTTFKIQLPLWQELECGSKSTQFQQPIGALK